MTWIFVDGDNLGYSDVEKFNNKFDNNLDPANPSTSFAKAKHLYKKDIGRHR